jgi:glycine oxidase
VSDTADVAVVGAGIVGTTCAWLLAREGLRVTVFDGEGIGSGSSGHGHGVLSLVGKDFRPGPHFELGRRSAAIYRDFVHGLIEDSGQDPLYHELPGLCLAIVDEEERIFRAEYARCQDMLDLRWIDVDEIRQLEPRITEAALGAVLYRHGQVDGYRMSLSAAGAVERLGGEVLQRRVTGLSFEGERVSGVLHTGGRLGCGAVVLAMGAWAAEADAWLGQHIPVQPLHGEVLNVRLPGPMLRTFILTARHGPILQRRDGIVLVGSIGGVTMSGMDVEAKHVFDPLDRSPAVYDLTPRPEAADLMIERALTVMPAIEDAELVGHLAGARPLSADRMPIIGPVPGRNGVFLATGHGTKGIHLAPITARMIADYVLHGGCRQAGIDPAAFLPGRFQGEGGRVRAMSARFGGA